MILRPTDIFSFERKKADEKTKSRIDFLVELMEDTLENQGLTEGFLLRIEYQYLEIRIHCQVGTGESAGVTVIGTGNALRFSRSLRKHGRRIDIREKYTDRLMLLMLGNEVMR